LYALLSVNTFEGYPLKGVSGYGVLSSGGLGLERTVETDVKDSFDRTELNDLSELSETFEMALLGTDW
jgi:hypothetical protein